MSFSEEEFEEFKSEALDLLDTGEKSLLSLDVGGDFREAFDAVFRSFHNLKGAAGMMELLELQAHTHELENILMQFKDATAIPKEYISLFLRGIDGARTLLDRKKLVFDYSVQASGAPVETPAALSPMPEAVAVATQPIAQSVIDEFLSESEEILDRVSANLRIIESKNYTKDSLDGAYRDIHSLKGGAFLFGFNTMGEIAHAMESSLEKVRNETHVPSKALLDILYKAMEAIELELECVKNKIESPHAKLVVPEIQKALSEAAAQLEKTVLHVTPTSSPSPVLTEAAPKTAAAMVAAEEVAHKEKDQEGTGSIRVPVALLDNLMTLMGEMVLVRNQVLQFSNDSEDLEFLNLSQRLNVVTSEIQGEMMKTRMQPIGNILSKFHRVVRDLSQDLGKKINLQLSGSETELDKSLLEAIKDPLTHIVRNSCDHGIETIENRLKAGKNATGTISIKSYHEGGQVVVEVSDDGKGLHRDALLRKAIEKNLITDAQGALMSEKDIYNLIFLPGFSTAQQVTNVSGRGVGMDVVRTNIEKIGGTVDLVSRAGFGTTLRLKIPLTLAIVPALIVHSGGATFAIPQVKLIELVRVDQTSENKIEQLQGMPVYRLRGDILPLIDLNQVLKQEAKTKNDSVVNIAVLNAEHFCFGLIIDEVQDTADIVVKPINRLLKSLQVYSGATVLGDGSVALILDVLGLSKVANVRNDANEKKAINALETAAQVRNSEMQDFLLVRLNSPTKHAIVLNYVNRLEEFMVKDLEISGSKRVMRYRNAILPIVSANGHLGYERTSAKAGVISVVVVERAGHLFGIEVDEILDTLSTPANLDTSLSSEPGFVGNLDTEQELVVVIDPYELISKEFPEFNRQVPSSMSAVDAAHSEQSAPVPSGPARILLVEDTVFFRKLVRGVLEQAGHVVTTAGDGVEAMNLLNNPSVTFDLIVSDIEMPRMNGFKLAEAVRADARHSRTPLLALSSRSDQIYIQQGTKAGFNVYLEKMKPEILLRAINQLVAQKRQSA